MASVQLNSTAEAKRLAEDIAAWRAWGPYLSDRSWGTVREDDSADGNAWKHFTHDQARSRAYRWGEDGIAGISDQDQLLNFALTLWNGKDPILKERFFGLDNNEGNHGEDVKEYWFYDDATPSHSWLRMNYKYPQAAFPYGQLVEANRTRGKHEAEYELLDTGVFADNRYFDVDVTYAKAGPEDIAIRITVANRGPEAAPIHLLPTLWYRNTWSWGADRAETSERPQLSAQPGKAVIAGQHETLGAWQLACSRGPEGDPQLLFTENESNSELLFRQPNSSLYVKDAFHRCLVDGETSAVNPQLVGTKAAAHYRATVPAGGSIVIDLRLRKVTETGGQDGTTGVATIIAERKAEADAFYAALQPAKATVEEKRIQRQAWAGMIWSKQWFCYNLPAWQRQTSPAATSGAHRRNSNWHHFDAADIISMPDKWEYPWFAAWDLAFHCIPLAYIDPDFAKEQLLLMVSERFQHPNGAISAYEWNFDDVNPPVLARAAWRVYHIEHMTYGRADRAFLEIMFQKLAINFAWWVNRKDASGNNLFGGGFLGLDNIGVFDRSSPLPTGGHLEQADGTAWVATFALDMAAIAQELEKENAIYGKLAVKYMVHFSYVARSMHDMTGTGVDLWHDEDGFYYDLLRLPDHVVQLKIRSMVGLIPLFATLLVPPGKRSPEREAWFNRFVKTRPDHAKLLEGARRDGDNGMRMAGLVDPDHLGHLLKRMLDPAEFLSDHGIRALSKAHERHPYTFMVGMQTWSVSYVPAESDSGMFGGNSNWRGPIWMPVNYFLVTALRRYHRFVGDGYTVEYPVGSGQKANLAQIADDLSRRLVSLFAPDSQGRRPINGGVDLFDRDPHWKDRITFFEYFHGDTGRGVGASHQTGWTGLVAALIQELHEADVVPVSM
jgi:hypothetical protein